MAKSLSKEEITAIFDEVYEDLEIDVCKVQDEEYPFNLKAYQERMKNRATWSKRYFRGETYGKFDCGNPRCTRKKKSWTSAHAYCILDLKRKEVARYFWQKCKECQKNKKQQGSIELPGAARIPDNPAQPPVLVSAAPLRHTDSPATACSVDPVAQPARPQRDLVYPRFHKGAMTWMIRWASKLFKVLDEDELQDKPVGNGRRNDKPHLQKLCEVCQIWGRPCFKRKFKEE